MGLIVIIIFREGFLLICWCSSGNIVMLLITMEVAWFSRSSLLEKNNYKRKERNKKRDSWRDKNKD